MSKYDDWPLRKYAEEVFLGVAKKHYTKSSVARTRCAVSAYLKWAGEDVAIGDVTPGTLKDFSESVSNKSATALKTVLRTAARKRFPHGQSFNDNLTREESKGVLQTGGIKPESLISDVLQDYFDHNLRIQNKKTRDHYIRSIRQFSTCLGHPATLADLNDDAARKFIRNCLDEGMRAVTVNQRIKQIRAFWEWAARKRYVEEFPTNLNLPEPEPLPTAYTRDELKRLFEACGLQDGWIGPYRASLWWLTFHWVILDTAERVGAVLALKKNWFNLEDRILQVPPEVRKGSRKGMTYRLSERSCELVAQMMDVDTGVDILFACRWKDVKSMYRSYRVLVESAGIAWVRHKSGPHKLRVTVASMLEANGGDATAFLKHTDRRTTLNSYIDQRVVLSGQTGPVSIGFDPEGKQPVNGGGEKDSRGLLGRLFRRKKPK